MRTALLVSGSFALLAAGCITSDVTGRRQLMLVSQDQEVQLGAQAWQETMTTAKVVTSGAACAQVKRVGEAIAKVTGKSFQWEFALVDDPKTVNAFCLPGGKVVVYSGILSLMRNDDELAVVIGHEIAHATCRHGGERISQSLVVELGIKAADLLVANRSEQVRTLTNGALGMGAQYGVLLPFSREHEYEADEFGLKYMFQAGYDPAAAEAFWGTMLKLSEGKEPPEFTSTHPTTANRIERLRTLAAELKKK
jgi:metalloendopeptidase OMA1, mitochondrial